MKTLLQTINEKLKISKKKHFIYKPKSLEELKKLIKEKVENNKNNILDLTDIDVSNLNSLENMTSYTYLDVVNNKTNIDTIDVSGWDVSNIKNFKRVFCSRLGNRITTIIGLDDWDISNGESFREFFSGCWNLTKFDGVENFKFGKNCNDISYFFASCDSITNIDLSNWDVSNISWMGGIFFECNALTKFSFKNWKTLNVFAMTSVFKNCYSLEKITDADNLDMTTCTDITAMFCNCKNLKTIEGIEKWNTEKLNSIENTFGGCINLKCDLSSWVLKPHIIKKGAFTYTSRKYFIKPHI